MCVEESELAFAGQQEDVLRYCLPALACAPPLLAQLHARSGTAAALVSVDVTVSPNLPGPLYGLTVDVAVPGAAAPPLRVRSALPALVAGSAWALCGCSAVKAAHASAPP